MTPAKPNASVNDTSPFFLLNKSAPPVSQKGIARPVKSQNAKEPEEIDKSISELIQKSAKESFEEIDQAISDWIQNPEQMSFEEISDLLKKLDDIITKGVALNKELDPTIVTKGLGKPALRKLVGNPQVIDRIAKHYNEILIHYDAFRQDTGKFQPDAVLEQLKKHRLADPILVKIDLTPLVKATYPGPERFKNEFFFAYKDLDAWAELGHPQALAEVKSPRRHAMEESYDKGSKEFSNCENNPVCFQGFSWAPYGGLGYQGVFRETSSNTFNPRVKFFFHNKRGVLDWNGKISLGLGPDFQGHFGSEEIAGSAGLALRVFGAAAGGEGAAMAFAELSFRGGVGELDTENKAGTLYQGFFQFFAADVTLSFLGIYAGAGLRKEFWSGVKDESGHLVDSKAGDHIYPTLSVGAGLF